MFDLLQNDNHAKKATANEKKHSGFGSCVDPVVEKQQQNLSLKTVWLITLANIALQLGLIRWKSSHYIFYELKCSKGVFPWPLLLDHNDALCLDF